MDIMEFYQLPVVTRIEEAYGFKVGTKFLFGAKMSEQVETSQLGREVSYYEIINVKPNGNIEYKTCFARLVHNKES